MPPEALEPRHAHRTVPAWVIILLGAIVTGAAVIWAGGIRDELGETLITDQAAKLLVAILGSATTLSGVLLQRLGEVRHQVKNSHGTNFRDDVDKLAARVEHACEVAEHAVRASRKASQDTVQLREDVQAGRLETGEVRADVRGLRKDIGRLADLIIDRKKES